MKKILIINTTLDKGGAARVARDLFDGLNVEFELFFAYGRGSRSSSARTFYFGNKLELLIHVFLVRFFGLEGWGSYFATRKLINFIKQEKFDVIHLHNLHGYYLNFFTLIKFIQQEKIPVAWTLHDEWPITWLPAHSLGCQHCLTGQGKCANTYGYPKSYFPVFVRYMLKKKREVFGGKWQPVIVCPSQWLKTSIKKSYSGKFDVQVISNGIDTELFKPISDKKPLRLKHNLPLDKKIIIFSASNLNDKSKGIDQIIKVAENLKSKNYLFLGLGQGEIESRANIKTTGYIYDQQQFADTIALTDLFCFASKAETFLLSAAEALACGVPVVGYDLPVVREMINKEVGTLVKIDNIQELTWAIATLVDNDLERLAKGDNGRQLIVNNYSKKIFIEKYKQLYETL